MRILMDADCLIKLTKSGFKECVIEVFEIAIPEVVLAETVDAGMQKGCADAEIIQRNILQKRLHVEPGQHADFKGDDALISQFHTQRFDCVATDDQKLTNRLKQHNIPYLLPATIIYAIYADEKITRQEALSALEKLSEFISEAEYSSTRLLFWRS